MDLEYIKTALKNIKPALSAKYGLETIGLFGSVVRDDFTEISDIDILVTFRKPIGIDFVTLADELENTLHRKVDLVSAKGLKQHYYAAISNEVIYV